MSNLQKMCAEATHDAWKAAIGEPIGDGATLESAAFYFCPQYHTVVTDVSSGGGGYKDATVVYDMEPESEERASP
jgi:hypothetical protein